jgi:hypothetical protein
MKKISSGMTFVTKRLFPIMWFGFLSFFLVSAFAGFGVKGPEMIPFIAVPSFMAVIGIFVFRKMIRGLADEVWDDETALIVVNKGIEERIPLTSVKTVNYSLYSRPQRVTLDLRDDGALGTEISFIPKSNFVPFSKNPDIVDLIDRVEEAKRNEILYMNQYGDYEETETEVFNDDLQNLNS